MLIFGVGTLSRDLCISGEIFFCVCQGMTVYQVWRCVLVDQLLETGIGFSWEMPFKGGFSFLVVLVRLDFSQLGCPGWVGCFLPTWHGCFLLHGVYCMYLCIMYVSVQCICIMYIVCCQLGDINALCPVPAAQCL